MTRDKWAEWLAERRCGGDRAYEAEMLEGLAEVRDRVLDHAALQAGETLLDVGCGDGLIAFGALERGAALAIFSDISQDLLDRCTALAKERGLAGRSQFALACADDLSVIADESVDVVTTRSVLIYVERKQTALAEFFRVLRLGGRVSLFEPINRFGADYRREESFWGYPLDGLQPERDKLNAVYERIQPLSDPMLDFDERDLVALCGRTGFAETHLELHVDIEAPKPVRWETWLHASGNPKIPTLAEAMETALTGAEQERVVAHLQPLVEQGRGQTRSAIAYVWATKPG